MALRPGIKAPELVRPRLDVLRTGLQRLEGGDTEEGAGTVRRMGKIFLNWAIGEGLEDVERASFGVVRAGDSELLDAGAILVERLEEILSSIAPSGADRPVILAVEDDPGDAALLEVALASPDRTLHLVGTGAEAEEILATENVALLVTDLRLPDTDGRALITHLRAQDRYRDLGILVLSGKGSSEVKAECMALGANVFFDKPVDPSAVAAAASSILHREARRKVDDQTDPLTHLLKRKAVRELWERWTFPEPSSIGMLGLDHFQSLEERFDHEIADRVLSTVGGLLKNTLPKGCVSARWHEALFLILCPGFPREDALGLLARLLDEIRGLRHRDWRGEEFRTTASGGAVEIRLGLSFDDAVAEVEKLLVEAAASGGNTLAETVSPEKAITILVAEDDPLSAEILIHRLRKEGFEVLHFPDGAQALEGAMSHRIDMAILDVKMPGMDGFELLETLRRVPTFFELPILMLTSMGREEDVARGFDLGADDYMVKPFSPVEVLARVRRLLKR